MTTPNLPLPQSAMCQLQGRWYQRAAVCLRQNAPQFQLAQPAHPVASDTQLWTCLNTVPPHTETFNSVLRRAEPFFDEYASIVGQFSFPASQFASDIGQANYTAWNAYVNGLTPPPTPQQLPALFHMWAIRNGAGAVAAKGVADLTVMAMCNTAKQALEPYQGSHPLPVDYMEGIDEVRQLLAYAPAAQIDFDGSAPPPSTPAWSRDSDDYLFGLWRGNDPRSRISQLFSRSNVTVQADFGAHLQWTSPAGAWYDSALLQNAYANTASPPWTEGGTPGWGDMFGPFGALRRAVANLTIVDAMHCVVECDAHFNWQDQLRIAFNVARGTWPFFQPAGAGVSTTATFDSHGRLKLETHTQAGSPIVIAANVLDISAFLGLGGQSE